METFINDLEKMCDFLTLSKRNFLNSYSYLTEEEYTATYHKFSQNVIGNLANMIREAERIHTAEINGTADNENFSSKIILTAVSKFLNNLSLEELTKFKKTLTMKSTDNKRR